MKHQVLIAAFIMVFLVDFAAFGMQRTTLLLSREAEIPYRIAAALLPAWFPAAWILIITKWGTLLFIAFSWSWGIAVTLLVVNFILSAVLPIPYSAYVPSFRRRIEQIKQADLESGLYLERMLNASKIFHT